MGGDGQSVQLQVDRGAGSEYFCQPSREEALLGLEEGGARERRRAPWRRGAVQLLSSSYYRRSGVEDDIERAKVGVCGEEGRACRDAEPVLADGAEPDDGFGRQAEEDLGGETLVEMNVDAHLLDQLH